MLSKVRLDPLSNVYDLRVYAESGDSSVALAEEMRQITMVARVTVAGHIAVVTTGLGDIPDGAWQDLDRLLLKKGVTELHWERHKDGKVLTKKRRVKNAHN